MRLLGPGGEDRGVLGDPVTHEAILRLAWGLGPEDALVTLLDGDYWRLAAVRRGVPGVRVLPMGPRQPSQDTADLGVLLEAAVLGLWDEGWTLKNPDI